MYHITCNSSRIRAGGHHGNHGGHDPCRRPIQPLSPSRVGGQWVGLGLTGEVWEALDEDGTWDTESVSEVVPEGDVVVLAGFHEAEEGVAAVTACIRAGAA